MAFNKSLSSFSSSDDLGVVVFHSRYFLYPMEIASLLALVFQVSQFNSSAFKRVTLSKAFNALDMLLSLSELSGSGSGSSDGSGELFGGGDELESGSVSIYGPSGGDEAGGSGVGGFGAGEGGGCDNCDVDAAVVSLMIPLIIFSYECSISEYPFGSCCLST
jgi:hypothetical protein